MACYAALVSVVQLLEVIEVEDDDDVHSDLLTSFKDEQALLECSRQEDKATIDSRERQIRDVAYEAQDIIETRMSNPGYEDYFDEELEEMKNGVGSIMEELMRINESYTSHQDHSGASTQASPKVGATGVRSKVQYCADQLSRTIHIMQRKSHGDSHSGSVRYNEQITSLIEKLSCFQELLRGYSPQHIDKETAVSLENRIEGVTFKAIRIIMYNVSTSLEEKAWRKYCERLKNVRNDFRSISWETTTSDEPEDEPEEYLNLKQEEEVVGSVVESLTTNQDNLQSICCYCANNAGASTQAPNFDSTTEASKVQAVSGKDTVVGLNEGLMTTIKEQLCGQPSEFQVLSIVGMGGIGKTTWARHIFDDKLICENFDRRAWVIVSQDHHLRNILLAIVSSLDMINIEELRGVEERELIVSIYQHLFGRRYLIIMDDVWDTKFLDKIKRIFPDLSNGSRLMITTRQLDVASNASTSNFIHHIPLLNEIQSWNLFCDRAFCPLDLEHIGRSIARKCGGLPLAIVLIAGLLSKSNMTKYDWEKIDMNISSTVAKHDEHFPKILSLSYNFMPYHLKPCFLHLGGLPEDCQIQAPQLIRLWVAEGFVEPTKSKSLEEVAERYLEDLVDRNLVLITKKKSSGEIKYCSIHDLLRDLCLQKSRQENFLHVINKNDQLSSEHVRNVRRLHITCPDSFLCFSEVKKYSPNLRSLYSFVETGDHFLSVASDFKLLRVLNAVDTRSSVSPGKIVELLHLRYLALPYLPVPPSISKLQNLETLVLDGDHTILPSEIWNMQRLRHVIIRQVTLPPIPQGEMISDRVPLLGRLQTLSTVVDFIFTLDTVEMIPSLKKLKVFYSEAFKSWDAFGLDNLVRLSQLETLHIEISSGESNMNIPVEPLPQNFGFTDSLKKVSLSGCRLPWRDMMVVGSLPNLQVLKLRLDAFLGEKWETIEGQFLKLKFLLMEKLLYLKDWRAENTHFPCLERLIIRNCQRLQEIPSGIGDISTLELIEAHGSRLAADSALRIQEEQRDHGNDVLQVHV